MAPEKATKKYPLGKVLVTGGCGALGSQTVTHLLQRYDCSVSVIDLRCSHNRRPDSDGVKYIEADITDKPRLLSVFEETKPDVVLHMAAPAPQTGMDVPRALFKKVNIDGTTNVVEVCQETAVKALVYTSSASIISDNTSDLIYASEKFPVIRGREQTEYYSETKAAAEEIVLKANRSGPSNLLTASIRPSGIFGEGDVMLVAHLVDIYRQGRHIFQVGDNNNLFDFTYSINVAHAHTLAAVALLQMHKAAAGSEPSDEQRVDGEAFLITNDQPVYFWDFARAIWRAAGCEDGTDKVWYLPRDIGTTLAYFAETYSWIVRKPPTFNRQRVVYSSMTRYYDITKAKRRLGYRPQVSMGEGIRRAVQWNLEHHG